VTNNEPDNKKILARFKDAGKYFASPFSQWNVESTLDFFHRRSMPTVEEAERRVFPATHKAQSVWDVLVKYVQETGVAVRTNASVKEIVSENGAITKVILKGGEEVVAKSFILATGGVSRPETGSTGDGFAWLKALGHKVNDTGGALVPLAVHDTWVKRLAGISLPAKITAFQNGQKQDSRAGKMLFTHLGLSGPAILNFSRDIGELLKYGDVTLEIDLFPTEGPEKVHEKLQGLLQSDINKMIKNSLTQIIPSALVPIVLELSDIVPETFSHSVKREQRIRLAKILKALPVRVKELLGLEKAIITSGGISLDEIDFKTMRSMKYSNLYIVGDLLDVNRPSGGYSLQLCWTTGHVAGTAAARDL
jgi:hypothetical protein